MANREIAKVWLSTGSGRYVDFPSYTFDTNEGWTAKVLESGVLFCARVDKDSPEIGIVEVKAFREWGRVEMEIING